MTLLVATAKAADANSYLTVARAREILRSRLYTTDWDNAAETPDAEGYLANGAASVAATTVPVDTGSGTFTANAVIKFAGHDTEYTVQTALSAAGNLSISPGLAAAVADDEVITRLTASAREKALIWATRLLEQYMEWRGTIRTETQALRWPRSGLLDRDGRQIDYDTIPTDLEEATAELALVLLGNDKFTLPELLGQGFKKAKVGSLSVEVDAAEVESVIPANVLALIDHLGALSDAAARGDRVIDLWRS